MEVGDVLEVGDIKEMESTVLGLSWFWGEKKRELGRFLWSQLWVPGWVVGPFTRGMSHGGRVVCGR